MPTPTPETRDHPPIAGRVVYRHACHCENANRPPGDAGDEYRFDVDGEPFPWFVTTDGARFTKQDGLYLVEVDILPIKVDGNRDILDVTLSRRRQPRIGDQEFPWVILSGSVRVEMLNDYCPLLHLTFVADEVDTDGDVAVGAEVVADPDEGDYQRYLATLAAGSTSGEAWGADDA